MEREGNGAAISRLERGDDMPCQALTRKSKGDEQQDDAQAGLTHGECYDGSTGDCAQQEYHPDRQGLWRLTRWRDGRLRVQRYGQIAALATHAGDPRREGECVFHYNV